MDLSRGTSIAFAVSALLAAAGCGSEADDRAASSAESVKCEGGNACKGQSECATADGKSLCAGENACKGTGYVFTETAAECTTLQLRNRP